MLLLVVILPWQLGSSWAGEFQDGSYVHESILLQFDFLGDKIASYLIQKKGYILNLRESLTVVYQKEDFS